MKFPKPIFGKTKQLIDRVPFLGENKFAELWDYSYYFMGIKFKTKRVETIATLRNEDLSISNNTFDFLKSSADFMNILINNINSCILLLNKDTRLTAFNDNLKTIFTNKKDENLIYKKCGEAIGCAYQIEEQKECGKTSMCDDCELRTAALKTFKTDEKIFKEHILRPFYNTQNLKVMKHLQFSTHIIYYFKEKFVVLLIEDITKFFQNK